MVSTTSARHYRYYASQEVYVIMARNLGHPFVWMPFIMKAIEVEGRE
jgi:hypothetical protein